MGKVYENYLQLKESAGLSSYMVSKKTGIPQTTISKWDTSKNIPKVESLYKLADFFNVDIEFFFQN